MRLVFGSSFTMVRVVLTFNLLMEMKTILLGEGTLLAPLPSFEGF